MRNAIEWNHLKYFQYGDFTIFNQISPQKNLSCQLTMPLLFSTRIIFNLGRAHSKFSLQNND